MGEIHEQRRICVSDTVDLLERLAEYYETPEEIILWFKSPQPLFDNQLPVDLIAEGKAIELHRVWDGIDAGTYI